MQLVLHRGCFFMPGSFWRGIGLNVGSRWVRGRSPKVTWWPMSTDSYFLRTGPTTFAPTPLAEGAWSREDYHFSPLAGLIVHAIEQSRGDSPLQLAQLSFDILGRLPFAEVDIAVEVIRPGRTIELVEAVVTVAGRSVILTRAWYLVAGDTTAETGTPATVLPAPEDCPPRDLSTIWGGNFMEQLEAREAIPVTTGRGATWLASPTSLVHGEEQIPVAQYCALIDTANGLAVRQNPEKWAFPNVDLTVHFFRQPAGQWVGLDTSVDWGASGMGITSSVLHDSNGPVGRALQSITLRKL